ncbi:MAG: hypothetical protein IJU39_06980 [Clostridia bacterium]|nr:hypothetical protein [Clostridia bacterium]
MFELSKKVFNFKRTFALIFSAILFFVNIGGADLGNDTVSFISSSGSKNHLLSVYSHCFYDSTVKLSST